MEDYLNIDPDSPTREKDHKPMMKDCPNCDGSGEFDYSDCCGSSIKWHDICSFCNEHCGKEICDCCKGSGEVEMDEDEIRDLQDSWRENDKYQ